ncbi:FdtA/QdtA family cupin domain-containing protein [Candidatus Cloacimonadota bacterium]
MNIEINTANTIFDHRGNLSIIEGERDLPFIIKRVFYIWANQDGHPRGGHAHRALFQSFISVHGECTLKITNGRETREITLDSPVYCATVPPGLWVDIDNFSADCVLMVLTSEFYDESDYIRDYDEYLSYVKA